MLLSFVLAFFQVMVLPPAGSNGAAPPMTPQQFTNFMNQALPNGWREVPLTTNECRIDEWSTPSLHDGKAYCLQAPQIKSVQLVLDPVQAKLKGNAHVKPCEPGNHDGVCVNVTMRHFTWNTYFKKENCEKREGVECAVANFDCQQRWVPIGKLIVVETKETPQ